MLLDIEKRVVNLVNMGLSAEEISKMIVAPLCLVKVIIENMERING